MTIYPKDPLLLAGKIGTLVAQAAMAIGAVALLIATPALVLFREPIANEIAGEMGDPNAAFPVLTLAGVMLLGLAMVALLFVFFGLLRRIIDTVAEGDPFQARNAGRLSRMGWLMLGVQLLMFPATALGIRLSRFADEVGEPDVSVGGGFDLTALLLVIILFILARVFRHGAAMRDDLEGTV